MMKLNFISLLFVFLCSLNSISEAKSVVPMGDNKLFDENTSYWAQYLPPANLGLKDNLAVDIAIIGGGYTGLSAAWHLKKSNPDLNIIILEAKATGSGASGRHGGLLLAQTHSEAMTMGEFQKYHKEIYEITTESMRNLKKLADSTGIDAEIDLVGHCAAITTTAGLDYYGSYVQKAQEKGLPLEMWDANKAETMLGASNLLGAVYDPNGGRVNAGKLVLALKKAVEQEGVKIFESSPVTAIIEGPEIVLSVANDKKYTVTAKNIVIATNAYTAASLGYFNKTVIPTHTQVAATYPLNEDQIKSINWKNGIAYYDDTYEGDHVGSNYHLILTRDNRILIGGGSVEHFNDTLRYLGDFEKISSRLYSRLIKLYPSLTGIKFEYVWDGIIAETRDEKEKIGVTGKNENIYYALGYNGGQGVNLSFLFGELVAKLYNKEPHLLLELYGD